MADVKKKKSSTKQQNQQTESTMSFSELFYRIIDKIWILIICAAIGAVGIGCKTIFATPMYEATSKVTVFSTSNAAVNLSDLQLGNAMTVDYVEIFNVWELHQAVVDTLSLPYDAGTLASMVRVTIPDNAHIMYITVRSADAEESAMIANEYAEVFSQIVAQAMKVQAPEVLSKALVPVRPIGRGLVVNTIVGLFVGGFIGFAIIFVQFLMDDKLKTSDEILRATGLITLAAIPVDGEKKDDRFDEDEGRSRE